MAQTIYLSTFGSFGDVYPFVALSVALKARGGRPIVFINPSFSDLFETHGIEAHAVGAPIDVDALLRDSPKYLHPRNGTRYAMEDLFAPFSAQTLAAASALAETTPPSLCVSHHLGIGTAWLARRLGIPSAVVHLSPTSLLSRVDPPVFGPGRMPPWARRLVLRLALPMFDRMADRIFGAATRALGVDVGGDGVDVTGMTLRPDLLLGLWSSHFRPAVSDDPQGTCITGFPLSAPGAGTSDALEGFLHTGPSPIAFSVGSASAVLSDTFFRSATAACGQLRARGLLFRAGETTGSLPEHLLAVDFQPFDEVLPRCAAFVHHGSAGSIAAGLRAGIPMVVMPLAHDQFDHAARVERLGVSVTIQRKDLSSDALVDALRRVGSEAHRSRARELGEEIRSEGDGASRAAELVLELER